VIAIRHLRAALWSIQSTAFSDILRQECRATPGLTWDPASRSWCGYSDAIAVAAKRARARGLIIQGCIPPLPPSGLLAASTGLRDYQKVGVDFLIAKAGEGCILADDLGLGKTLQSIVAIRALRQKTVIVCPAFVRGVWLDGELPKWWPTAHVVGLKGVKAQPVELDSTWDEKTQHPAAIDVVVIHYDILYAWVDTLIAWGVKAVVFDEGHALMGERSRRTQAAVKLSAACTYRIMLTGTPMTSRPRDLWSPVNTISEGRFGKFFNFGLAFCAAHQEQVTPTKTVWKMDGASNLPELNERLNFSPATPWGFMLRRLKSDVALELPARQRQILTLEVAKSYMMAPAAAMRSDHVLRKALDMAADGKFPQVIDLVLGHLEAGHKVVVGCYRRVIADLIADGVRQKGPWGVEVITGEVPLARRNVIIAKQPDLLCCTIDSTSVGINLSFASVAVIAELVWVPSSLIQFEGRFGRHEGKSILVQYCCARGTADDVLKGVLLRKLDQFTTTIGKTDNKLREDFKGLEGPAGAAARMAALYERMRQKEEDE
jgi:SWI/SNF-related matrix-associated actin-dependent regulator 1 of chromatin subfamily A